MKFINLCPHVLRVVVGPTDEDVLILEPAARGQEARAEEIIVGRQEVDSQEVEIFVLGKPVNLPEAQKDTIYVVSAMVMSALITNGVQRNDVVAPNTGKTAIRKDGQIWAVRGWRKLIA